MAFKKYIIVLTDEQRNEALEHIYSSDYLAFDTETTGLNVRKDKVIGLSFSGNPGIAYYLPLYEWDKGTQELVEIQRNTRQVEFFLTELSKKELLMWNGSFDIRAVKNNFNIDLTNSLVAEGMLLKHTVEEEGDFGLKKVGVAIQRYIGFDVEEQANQEQLELKSNVKANGGSTTKNNFEMYKADLEILGKYACADADLTLRICEYYKKKLEDEGLEEFFYDEEVMPLYREVTIPMEDRGVKIDLNLLKQSKEEIEEDLVRLEREIINQLMESGPFDKWFEDRCNNFSITKPSGDFLQEYITFFGFDLPKSEKTGKYRVSRKLLEKLPERHHNFLFNEGSIDPYVEAQIKRNIYMKKTDKIINISSKKQMGEFVFDYMGIQPLSYTEKGSPQFNDIMVEYLSGDNEWAETLHIYNKLVKIKGAYIDRFLDNHEDGHYYFSYKQHGTISGRYGSDAQQLPRPLKKGQEPEVVLKYNNRIRAFFISGPNRSFVDCDYESLEPHVFAHVSGDEGLRDIFRKGHDFYSTIAIATEGLYEYSADKKADNYLGELNKPKRQTAKAYALGVPYGMTGYALGKSLDIPTDEAEELVENYLGTYPKLKEWMDRSKRIAQTKGFIKSEVGRIRHLPKVKKLYKIYGEKLLDFIYRRKLQKRMDKEEVVGLYMDYKNGINNSRNYQIQSMAGSIVNRAAIAINREFIKKDIYAWCCAQVHDQLIFNIPEAREKECSEIIQDKMENTTKLSLDLKAPPSLAKNWRDGH